MAKIRTAITALLFVAIVNSPAAQAQPPSSPNAPPVASPPAAPPAAPPPAAEPPAAGTPAPEKSEAAGNKGDEKGDGSDENTMQELRLSRRGLGMEPGALNFGDLVLPPPPGSQ